MADPPAAFDVTVSHNIDELVSRAVAAIVDAIAQTSHELRETHIPDEAPVGPSGALASAWLEREVDPLTRIVFPGDAAWYAHIVARGRGEVTPRWRRALTIGGEFRAAAGPMAGNPFHERAIVAVSGRADDLLDAALSDQGL